MDLVELCKAAKAAKYELQKLSTAKKNEVLLEVSKVLLESNEHILIENANDMAAATSKGLSIALIDRLRLSDERIAAMAEGLVQVAQLPDPIGEVIERIERPNGLLIEKCRVPLGVIGIIYEARPNVTVDAFGLCFKSGNAVILKGGSDAIHSNAVIVSCIRQALKNCGVTEDAICFVDAVDRETTMQLMQMADDIDVLIPRGGAGLIRSVVENSRIPVIETGTGNCHIYIDDSADPKIAREIILNAKTQRIGVCNACESLVVHEAVKDTILKETAAALQEKRVEIRGDEAVVEVLDCKPATEEDFGREYLDYIISVKTVASIDEAIEHINHYNTGHSECIITQDPSHAERFLNEVDAACVYVNASTRFTDGYEFGFGAEIGISTQMLHARGPMGLKELTSYKYKVHGNGQIRK
ncbi:MAG: glutamate-5-semialdehyde dehydrogenase [Lachnospiraceae bacterium]|nr:glutamate-5-semialdehyde dehydrogenase [Lachnospiraceae bacterium]